MKPEKQWLLSKTEWGPGPWWMKPEKQWLLSKTEWGPGPWQDEPDEEAWQDEETGLPCLILRGPGGALCGYVAVPEGHPLYGKKYSEQANLPFLLALNLLRLHGSEKLYRKEAAQGTMTIESLISAHGGITYAMDGAPNGAEGWWFGFDCAHAGDETPYLSAKYYASSSIIQRQSGNVYRDMAYVKAECARLAEQLHFIGEWMKESKDD